MKLDKQNLVVVFSILCIIYLASFFHFQIHFENALTLLPEPDYGFKISIWRIIFEPIIGLLLFFNRSIYPLEELPIAFLWILFFYVGFSAISILSKTANRRKLWVKNATNLPLLLGCCLAIFILILFVLLPNNTIVNNAKNSILVTTHAHTEFSHDGLITQENMWKWHKRNGFDAFFITDHRDHKKSLEFAKKQRDGNLPIQPLVMVGQEFSGSNHMSLLGLIGKFDTKGMKDKAVIDSVHRYGGAVIVNHWFDGKGEAKELYQKLGVDGFEIENSGSDLYYDRSIFKDIKKFAKTQKLSMLGGLDFHGYGRVCSLYNAFEIPNWHTMNASSKENAILKIIKNGTQEDIKVLMYKDRTFYTNSNLYFRPFVTLINYFRTLNIFQVLSWIFWLVLFQVLRYVSVKASFWSENKLLITTGLSAVFMLVLAILYAYRGSFVKGYSKVYSEYSQLMGSIGLVLLLYVLVVGYIRYSASYKNTLKNEK